MSCSRTQVAQAENQILELFRDSDFTQLIEITASYKFEVTDRLKIASTKTWLGFQADFQNLLDMLGRKSSESYWWLVDFLWASSFCLSLNSLLPHNP